MAKTIITAALPGAVTPAGYHIPETPEQIVQAAGIQTGDNLFRMNKFSLIQQAEERRQTVLEAFPDSPMAEEYRELARRVLAACGA